MESLIGEREFCLNRSRGGEKPDSLAATAMAMGALNVRVGLEDSRRNDVYLNYDSVFQCEAGDGVIWEGTASVWTPKDRRHRRTASLRRDQVQFNPRLLEKRLGDKHGDAQAPEPDT